MDVSVIGLGKLGLCTAACFAAKGHRVWGVDKNTHVLDHLARNGCPIQENGLQELLEKACENLTLTTRLEDAVFNSEITLIIVPTPSKSNGEFSNRYVLEVLRTLGPLIRKKEEFHVLDIVSTVMPGSFDRSFRPLLERITGKKCGTEFGLVYNPEFIALGSVVRDFLNPDMVLIGTSDKRSAALLKELYTSTCDNEPHIAVMSLVNAEITKLSLNCFVTMKLSFVNELASICEKVRGADIDVITDALGSDSRVGGRYLKAGLGFGGTCFPRDNAAFQAFARARDVEPKLSPQVVAVNNAVVDRLFDVVRRRTKKNQRVAIFGLSYKPGTHIVEESQSVLLIEKLLRAGYSVAVHDPRALKEARKVLGTSVTYCDDPYSCARNAKAVVLMTNWPMYGRLDWKRIGKGADKEALVVDSWRILKDADFSDLSYFGLGLYGNGESF